MITSILLPNIRDFASAEELVVCINFEGTNDALIKQEVPKPERLKFVREKGHRWLELLKTSREMIVVLIQNMIEDTEKIRKWRFQMSKGLVYIIVIFKII